MSRERVVVVCPGRGSYDRSSLGSLKGRGAAARDIIAACDSYRRTVSRPPVSEIDADATFRPARHIAGEHASLLTFACSLADLTELSRERYEIVGVLGNSMGFYTALAASGALSLQDAVRLVETMGGYQENNVIGGQVIYPLVREDWSDDPALHSAVEEALASAVARGAVAEWSIRLGSFAVLGADEPGIAHLLSSLPPQTRGERTYPLRLPLHSAFHTSLLTETALRAQRDLLSEGGIVFRAPEIPLVDGRGVLYRPISAEPSEIADYTLGHQVYRPYDFATSLLSAVRRCAPDRIVLLGPGNPLGGPSARTLVADGWRGIRTRADLDAQSREDPRLLSFGVAMQRRLLV